ncbi:potassium channel subfamily K member 5-like [Nothobranchius furzeri]|uniref:Potassium channel subfamily K member 5-like n=1 Tax=Nothobranchius furzeri TaxID=105023 RepID=A0A9D3BX33_NOTFU|nr:potassium channel subfamily K member 5-like [Nothobranchius furzeri]
MADKGPFLTSCIIFYLSIGAAIFQILEEPNWKSARDRYIQQQENILAKHACLTKEDLDEILKIASEAAGQGVAITGDNHRNSWDWRNSVIFAATIVTTIGYGNVAPKTNSGRVFCILYGLCGIPLCLVWISTLGSFFGDRAKRLSQVLIRKGVSVKKVQVTCTALFLLWGLLFHLVIPPFVFMSVEGWSYLEGIYFSFITLTTVGFGDYVAGVNPDIQYPSLYRVSAELWIYMGLAWLSLFFSWNVHMVVEAHKVLKKKRQQWHRHHHHHHHHDITPEPKVEKKNQDAKPTVVDIFNFRSEENEDYSTVIKKIGLTERRRKPIENIHFARSKSCSDILANTIETLDHSPLHRRNFSFSEIPVAPAMDISEQEDECFPGEENVLKPELREKSNHASNWSFDSDGTTNAVPNPDETEKVPHSRRGETRFTISKVTEANFSLEKNENG